MGFTFRSPRELREKENLLLKGTHKISHALGLRAETVTWKESESDIPADLESLQEKQDENTAQLLDIDMGSRNFWEVLLPQGH